MIRNLNSHLRTQVDTRGINTLERLVLGEAHTTTTMSLYIYVHTYIYIF